MKMQKVKEKEITDQKMDCYMPIDDPTANKMYQLIKKHEKEILNMVAFTIPTVELRKHMDTIRGHLKHVSCEDCEHLGRTKKSVKEIPVLIRDDELSKQKGRLVKVADRKWITKRTMACGGCRALRLKQIATGYIKNRRFKQV